MSEYIKADWKVRVRWIISLPFSILFFLPFIGFIKVCQWIIDKLESLFLNLEWRYGRIKMCRKLWIWTGRFKSFEKSE